MPSILAYGFGLSSPMGSTFYKNVAKCWSESGQIKEFGPNQVHMAPFEVILKQNGSYRGWEASGMPPGL